MKGRMLLTALFSLIILSDTLAQSKQPAMTNADVIKLVKTGLDNDIIITTIESATGKFDVSSNGLINLKAAKVPASVIKSMINSMQGAKSQGSQAAMVSTTTVAPATGNARIPEPDIINAIYVLDKLTHNLKPLEKNNATQKVRRAALGYGATTYTCEIPGEKSGTRLTPDEALSFVINTGGAAPDAVVLFKAALKKKQRMAIMSKITGLGSMKGAQGSSSCSFKMLKAGIYEITPPAKLERGEYFFTTKQLDFTTMANMDVYAFGVD